MGQDDNDLHDAGAGFFELTRRRLLAGAGAGAGGVMLLMHQLAEARPRGRPVPAAQALPEGLPTQPAASSAWSGPPGQARFRIEGLAKVTGQKIYARDFRSKDFPSWPKAERAALVLRAPAARRQFLGLDLAALQGVAQPLFAIVQSSLPDFGVPQKDLVSLNLMLPFWMKGPDGVQQILVPPGTPAQFFGQPVAILVFENAAACRRAQRALQFRPEVVRLGDAAPDPVDTPYGTPTYLTRYEVPGLAPFSQVQSGYESNPHQDDSPTAPYNRTARRVREAIDAELARPGPLQLEGRYRTQVLDPMLMEPEAGLAWFDAKRKMMNLVLGTQATNGDTLDTFNMFQKSAPQVDLTTVALYACYPGGGFGGRDVSMFPPLLAVTAALCDGPVRIAEDRYGQFQGGLKQLASDIHQRIAVDPKSGEFIAFASRQVLPAGGNQNYSPFVASLAGYCGLSGYLVKQAYVDAEAKPTLGVVAGSMRGFGGPQASWAVETMVDEVALALKRDPIELRARNVLKPGDRTITGAPIDEAAASLAEICRRAQAHPLWKDREKVRKEKAKQGRWYGVGFALANQAYGTGTDGVMAEVTMAPDGALTVRSNCVDMGNGSATTLAISTAAWLGANASQALMGDVATFNALGMTGGSKGGWDDPTWTASVSMSSSACLTAFHQVHVAEQASRVLFETGLLPAAAVLWRVPLERIQGRTRWADGRLHAEGLAPLPLAQLAAEAHRAHLPVGAMVHGLYQGTWVSASYKVAERKLLLPIDGLALARGGAVGHWQRVERKDVIPPDPAAELYGRSLYAPSGALVAVEIDPRTFEPRVVAVDLIVDAGKVLQPDLLTGQAQGGIAMGIGYALLEDLPIGVEGAGNGRWNLDRYHVAMWSDVPLGAMKVTALPSSSSTAKGIAEAVLCPIAPAIGNAVAAATGYRFRARSLPIRASDIREGLRS
ncbi:xanthine dehydrogenase family protein molybdopterin-binding subunit [Inhella sp.]|uniref:xanthine dehydrogenase family protein molybdopterin-binding subunit n=1 Tax=Inhella sp. TaxID=1921806 RepID=UPI0035B41FDC